MLEFFVRDFLSRSLSLFLESAALVLDKVRCEHDRSRSPLRRVSRLLYVVSETTYVLLISTSSFFIADTLFY